MKSISIDLSRVYGFITPQSIQARADAALKCNSALHDKTDKGNDFLGWVDLPSIIDEALLADIEHTAALLKTAEICVVVGIGGSYLGAKAVNDALMDSTEWLKEKHSHPLMLFAGHNISEDYLYELLQLLDNKEYCIIVISKSGTTTEPAIAFRILKDHLVKKSGKDKARERIVAITDARKGALRSLADAEGYKTYVIPDDVGGRYSVLTPVGLVPLAICGINIRQLVKGAADMSAVTGQSSSFGNNIAAQYAVVRNELYKKGKKIELLVNYNPKLHFFAEWWKQLFGESEGKEGKGIYPSSVDFSSDLHSMGQYIQEGERILFETVLSIETVNHCVTVPAETGDLDKLNFLQGKRIDHVNKMAELGTILAHADGGVPNIRIVIPQLNEYYLGQLIYFFEKACGISGYLLGVNPFDQPGVESYKKNMFALLEKPGFEEETRKIKQRI